MPGLIQKQMAGSAEDELNEQEPVEGPGPDGSVQHEAAEGEQPEPNDTSGAKSPDEDPGYLQAVQFAMDAMYKNKAAKDIARSLKNAPDKVEAMANTAYEIVSITDEKTNGSVPDEMLAAFATFVLEEVADIADAAGVQVKPSDVALALKQMILRFLGEQGVDTTQLQQAMDKVDPEEFNRAAGEQEVPA